MTRRAFMFMTAMLSAFWLATGAAATQEGPAAAPPWDFPTTADGQPDIQGMWIPDEWGRPLEMPEPRPPAPRHLGAAEADHRPRTSGSMFP